MKIYKLNILGKKIHAPKMYVKAKRHDSLTKARELVSLVLKEREILVRLETHFSLLSRVFKRDILN